MIDKAVAFAVDQALDRMRSRFVAKFGHRLISVWDAPSCKKIYILADSKGLTPEMVEWVETFGAGYEEALVSVQQPQADERRSIRR